MRKSNLAALVVGVAAIAGCTHLKGVVLEDASGKPLKTAVLTVGVPEGIGTLESYSVNVRGEFDFQIGPTDDTAVYVYDSAGPAQDTLRHLDRNELSDHMTIRMRKESPDMLPGMNQ